MAPKNCVRPKEVYPCGQCGIVFRTYGARYGHIASKHINIRYSCDLCEKDFACNAGLKSHKLRAHTTGPLPHKCATCHKSYPTLNQFNRHLKSHLGDNAKPHQCHICGKKFFENGDLKRHVNLHRPDRRQYPCELCPMKFKTKAGKLLHVSKIHEGVRQSCVFCEQLFKDVPALNSHIRRHINEYLYTCKICGKEITSKVNFRRHMLTHATESKKKYECNVCAKKFTRGTDLRRHAMAMKPYKCAVCCSVFWCKSAHKEHLLRAHSRASFDCVFCERKFVELRGLYQHIIVHIEEFPFDCENCGKPFPHKYRLENHRKTCNAATFTGNA